MREQRARAGVAATATSATQYEQHKPREPREQAASVIRTARERRTEKAALPFISRTWQWWKSQRSMDLRHPGPVDTSRRNSEEVPDSWRLAHFLHGIVFSSSRRLTAERGSAAQQGQQQRRRYSSRRTRRRRRREHPSDQRGGRVSMSRISHPLSQRRHKHTHAHAHTLFRSSTPPAAGSRLRQEAREAAASALWDSF